MTTTRPIDYASPPRAPPRPIMSTSLTAALTAFVCVFVAIFLFVIPRFEEIFRDFKAQLPVATRLLLTLSHVCGHAIVWIPLLLTPSILLLVERRFRGLTSDTGAAASRSKNVLASVVAIWILLMGLMIYAIFSPLIPLGGGISSPTSAVPQAGAPKTVS